MKPEMGIGIHNGIQNGQGSGFFSNAVWKEICDDHSGI